MLKTDEGKVLACSAWGTAYEFAQAEWDAFAVVPETPRCPGDGQP